MMAIVDIGTLDLEERLPDPCCSLWGALPGKPLDFCKYGLLKELWATLGCSHGGLLFWAPRLSMYTTAGTTCAGPSSQLVEVWKKGSPYL